MKRLVGLLAALALAGAVEAQDIQFRGPSGGGASAGVTPGVTTFTGCTNLVAYGDGSGLLNCEAALGYNASTDTFSVTNVVSGLIIPSGTGKDLGAHATAFRNLYLHLSGTYATGSWSFAGTPTGARVATFPGDASFTFAGLGIANVFTANQTIPAGSASSPSLQFTGAGGTTGYYSRTANVLDLTVNGATLWDIQASQFSNKNTMQIGWSTDPTGTGMNVAFSNDATGVVKTTNGSSGVGWIQNGGGASRVTTSDITNATTTFANITGISASVTSARKYAGRLTLKVVDSTAAEGIKIDFNGGSATMTSFWAACHQDVGGTVVIGTAISTSLAGVINFSTITGETIINCDLSFVPSSTSTFIPRQAQDSHSSGTLTVRVGSFMLLEDIP